MEGVELEPRGTLPRDEPNDNLPAEVPPGTVGPESDPGDQFGIGMTVPPGLAVPPPQPWAGWPAEWAVPNWWGRVEAFTDTAWAGLDLNSSVLAAMPPYLVTLTQSPNADWITNPNPDYYSSWFEFMKQYAWDYQMGEAFILATARYATGWPARFHVVPPWTVNVELGGDGLRRYSIGEIDVTADILHVPYCCTCSDARGHGPLEAGGARLVAANMLVRYATQLARSGAIPNSVLVHPQKLNNAQAEDLQAHWVNARMSSLGLPAVLSGGLDFKTLSFSPKDAAMIELSQYTDSRIAVLLGIPPFLLGLPSGGDSLTYNTAVMLREQHWQGGLKPRATALMQALSTWALPRGTTVELNRDEYVRPPLLERAQAYQLLISLGVMSADQVAEIERTTLAAPTATLSSGVLQ